MNLPQRQDGVLLTTIQGLIERFSNEIAFLTADVLISPRTHSDSTSPRSIGVLLRKNSGIRGCIRLSSSRRYLDSLKVLRDRSWFVLGTQRWPPLVRALMVSCEQRTNNQKRFLTSTLVPLEGPHFDQAARDGI